MAARCVAPFFCERPLRFPQGSSAYGSHTGSPRSEHAIDALSRCDEAKRSSQVLDDLPGGCRTKNRVNSASERHQLTSDVKKRGLARRNTRRVKPGASKSMATGHEKEHAFADNL